MNFQVTFPICSLRHHACRQLLTTSQNDISNYQLAYQERFYSSHTQSIVPHTGFGI